MGRSYAGDKRGGVLRRSFLACSFFNSWCLGAGRTGAKALTAAIVVPEAAAAAKSPIVAVTARRPPPAVAPVSTVAISALTLAVVLFAHHNGGLVVKLFHLNGQEAKNICRNAHLPFHLDHGLMGRIDIEERVVRTAILLDLVCGGLEA